MISCCITPLANYEVNVDPIANLISLYARHATQNHMHKARSVAFRRCTQIEPPSRFSNPLWVFLFLNHASAPIISAPLQVSSHMSSCKPTCTCCLPYTANMYCLVTQSACMHCLTVKQPGLNTFRVRRFVPDSMMYRKVCWIVVVVVKGVCTLCATRTVSNAQHMPRSRWAARMMQQVSRAASSTQRWRHMQEICDTSV